MSGSSDQRLSIRLSFDGAQEARAQLEQLGQVGDTAMRKLETGGQAAGRGVAAVSAAGDALRAGLGQINGDLANTGRQFEDLARSTVGLAAALRTGAGLAGAIGGVVAVASAAYAIFQNWDSISKTFGSTIDWLTGRYRENADELKKVNDVLLEFARLSETAAERAVRAQVRTLESLATAGQASRQALSGEITSLQGEFDRRIGFNEARFRAQRQGEAAQIGGASSISPEESERILQMEIEGIRQRAANDPRVQQTSAELRQRQGAVRELDDRLRWLQGQIAGLNEATGSLLNAPPPPPGGGGGGSGGGRATRQEVTEAEREYQRLVQQGVQLAGTAATEQQRYGEQVLALSAALGAARITQEQYNAAVAALDPAARAAREAQEQAARQAEQFARRSRDALAQIGETAMDRIGTGLVNAFTSGGKAALDFQSLMKGVTASIAADLLKLAVVTPITNAVFGTSRPTLMGAFGGAAQPSAPVVGASGMPSVGIGEVLGFSGLLGGGSSGGMFSGLGSSLGLTGSGGLLTTPLFTTSAGAMATAPLPAGVMGPVLPATALGPMGMGTTFGSLLGGAGVGFGAGMLTSSLVGSQRGTVGPGGTIGAGGGALAGALIGSIFPGVGTLAGGLIGGALGGGGGAMFGPTRGGMASRSGGDVYLGTDANGQLIITGARGKRFDEGAARSEVQAQLDAINQQIGVRGLSFAGAGQAAVGFGAASGSPRELSLTSLVGQLRGGNANQMTAFSTLAGRGGNLEQALQAADFITQIFEPLSKAGEQTDSFTAAMEALAKTYDDAITKARDLGLATEALDAKRSESLAKLRADTQRGFDASVRGARGESFVDQLMGVRDNFQANAGSYLAAGRDANVLYAAQVSAIVNNLDVKQLATAIDTLNGFDDVAVLFARARKEQLEAAEAQIKAAEAAQATAETLRSALAAGGAIRNYLDGLSATSAGGLSPSDQFTNAQSIFGRDLALSRGGDLDALGRITGSAENLLSAGRGMFASGSEFQALLQMVQSSLANLPATRSYEQQTLDTLTRIANGQQVAVELLGLLSADANRDQRITWPEFEAWTRANEAQTSQLASALGVSNTSLASIFTQLDSNGDGTLAQLEIQSALSAAANNRLDGVISTGTGTVEQLVQQNSLSSALVALGQLTYSGNTIMAASLQAANQSLITGNRYAAATAYNTMLAANRSGGGGIPISGFAKGGVFDGPIMFPMRDGMGMLGEAGPEAIMPLARGSDGSLGVRVAGGGSDGMAKLINGLIAEVAELRAEMRRMADAGERTADATEDTAATNSTMARREVIVGRRVA